MPKATSPRPKQETLRRQNCLNPHPETIVDPLFALSDFFDPHDLVQVKYEMLRRVHAEGATVSASSKAFGFSRPSFYQAQTAFQQGGLTALIPKKRGPRRAHKLDHRVVEYLRRELAKTPHMTSVELKSRVFAHFGIKVHERSVERALARQKKKRRNLHRSPAKEQAMRKPVLRRTKSSGSKH